jgi:flagellar basal-body rod protein FlgG
MRVLDIASTGMQAQTLNIEVISNNIANLETIAFKRGRAEFADLLYQAERRQGVLAADTGEIRPVGVEVGLGVRPTAVSRIFTQGAFAETGNQLDVALQGRGFFQVELPTGELVYTRAGNFQVSPEGELVTVEGFSVQPGIVIPENTREVVINQSGEVFALVDDDTVPQLLGQFNLASFINEAGLEPLGDNLYRQTEASGDPQEGLPGDEGFATILQGFQEQSNVNIVDEITSLITAQRSYELNSRVIEAGDQLLRTIAQIR